MYFSCRRFEVKCVINFLVEILGKESHPLEVESTKELPQIDSRDVSSQDNSDEDDEVALREQLLKSLAVKRKAKIDAGVKHMSLIYASINLN